MYMSTSGKTHFQTYLYNMQFDKIVNAKINNEADKPLMKKRSFSG